MLTNLEACALNRWHDIAPFFMDVKTIGAVSMRFQTVREDVGIQPVVDWE